MTQDKALYSFFNSAGMPGYPNTSVPEDVTFPYLTYEYVSSHFNGENVTVSVDMWFNTESEAIPNEYARNFADMIGSAGKLLDCDEGFIWVKRGDPWCTAGTDEGMPSIKRRTLNVVLEYLIL